MADTHLYSNCYPPEEWNVVTNGNKNSEPVAKQNSFINKTKFAMLSDESETDLNDPEEFPTIDDAFKHRRLKTRMTRIARRKKQSKHRANFSDEDTFDFDKYISEENLKLENVSDKTVGIVNKLWDTLPNNLKDESFAGYVYEEDQTLDGPDSQWELLKYARVDEYESQKAKAERLHLEKVKRDCEERVAREAKLGPRAENLSAWDAVASEYESDANDEDAAWLDELLMESGEVATPPLMSQAEAKLQKECSPGGQCGCGVVPRRSTRRSKLNLTAAYAGQPIPEVEEVPEIVGHLCPLTFKEQAMMAREQCKAEREAAEMSAPSRITPEDRPINEMKVEEKMYEDGWQKVSMAVDSGAAETVIPHTLVTGHPIRETEASRRGVNYASATGQPIPNLGEQRLPLCTMEGTLRSMTFQATPVARPLGSVKRMMESGHRVVFDPEGCYIENKGSGEINWLREENGNFMMDMWIMPVEQMNSMSASFGRPS